MDIDLTPGFLIRALYAEIERVYGKEYAQACILYYGPGGWYAISFPYKRNGKWKRDPLTKPMRHKAVVQILENLKTKNQLE